ncbi:sortase [Candidatus Peregrinibacteria bacterium]|jgi:LPXTG-site transpeptidase (sortase) family protein|nr:sortase [Candidatus Peregrinibacteria bacterium]MBT7736886.1 sortase [Candidatus Peregrinibacteria bacterium]
MKNEENEKRSVKVILLDAGRQLLISGIFLVVGFIVLNWGSLYELGRYKWDEINGNIDNSKLEELTESKTVVYNQKVLEVSDNPEDQKNQIPSLDIDIAPSDDRLIIPRINKNIPIVRISSEALVRRDWNALETEMQGALQGGVVHYPGTGLPGQGGNIAITGHSSYFPWDDGRFKDVFALLHEVVEGDKLVVYHDQEKYLYEINAIDVVLPQDIDILKQTPEEKLTLITCTPIGTNYKRLVVTATPIEEIVASNDGGVVR